MRRALSEYLSAYPDINLAPPVGPKHVRDFMDRTDVAERTAKLIFELEDLIDATLNKSGELVSHLPAARIEAGLSATYGQKVFENTGRLVNHLIDARRAMVETHNGCEAMRRSLRIQLGGPCRADVLRGQRARSYGVSPVVADTDDPASRPRPGCAPSLHHRSPLDHLSALIAPA